MLAAKDILPAAAPLGSLPLGSVMIITFRVAATVLVMRMIVNASIMILDRFIPFIIISPPQLRSPR